MQVQSRGRGRGAEEVQRCTDTVHRCRFRSAEVQTRCRGAEVQSAGVQKFRGGAVLHEEVLKRCRGAGAGALHVQIWRRI